MKASKHKIHTSERDNVLLEPPVLSLSLYGDESAWEGEGSLRSAQPQCVRDSACVR